MAFDAIVLAGGTSRRMAPVSGDKVGLDVGGASLLDRAIAAVAAARQVMVIGPPRPVVRQVVWAMEEPAGGGPAAALMAGLAHVGGDVVVVLAADLPFAAAVVPRLVAALLDSADADAAMAVDESGRRQPLLAAYTATALRAREGPWANRSIRELVKPLTVVEVPVVADEALDCDTPADLTRARSLTT